MYVVFFQIFNIYSEVYAGSTQAVQPGPASKPNQQKCAQPIKKENASLEQRIEILDWHYTNDKNQTKTTSHFNQVYPTLRLTQPRISDWMKQEAKW